MVSASYEDLLSRIQEAEVVSLCRDPVRFESVNPPGDELEIAEYVAGVLCEAGLTVEMIPIPRLGPVCWPGWRAAARCQPFSTPATWTLCRSGPSGF